MPKKLLVRFFSGHGVLYSLLLQSYRLLFAALEALRVLWISKFDVRDRQTVRGLILQRKDRDRSYVSYLVILFDHPSFT